jgi:putrescine transport system ATP-binding protein
VALGALSVEGLTKRWSGTAVLDGLDLSIAAGGFFALLGASGSGKTTLLRLVAGFEAADAGRIRLDGVDITGLPPYGRPVNLVFQSYALFPHMTVAENVAFGLRREGLAGGPLHRRVEEMLALVRLEDLAGRRPREISGGQAQRVALARALAKRPKLLLLDEPMAALDRGLREHMRQELKRIHRALGTTFVLVTHDQEEALSLADRVALLDRGRLAQEGTPEDLYERPASLAVARFIGRVNLLEGRVVAAGDPLTLEIPGLGAMRARPTGPPPPVGAAATLCLRPEKVDFGSGDNARPATIGDVAYLGDQSLYRLTLADGVEIRALRSNRDGQLARPGERVTVSWAAASALVFAGGVA